jgi:hypothetical protein
VGDGEGRGVSTSSRVDAIEGTSVSESEAYREKREVSSDLGRT